MRNRPSENTSNKSKTKNIMDINIVEELSMFSITDNGKFEGVGAHDDLDMGLALANSATHDMLESIVLLDDMAIFDNEQPQASVIGGGMFGLNF